VPPRDPDAAHTVSAETLALIALGEPVATAEDTAHLLACPECRAELDALARAADAGRASFTTEPLESPSPEVWNRISAAVGTAPDRRPRPRRAARRAPRRRMLVAAVAALALVAGGTVVWRTLAPTGGTPDDVLANADLLALPAWPSAGGEAVVASLPDGGRVLRLTLDVPDDGADSDYHEAWLLTSDAASLLSLGIITGDQATFAIPAGLDLALYDVVDVSAEAYDGDPLHSGDSIVRGTLTSE
jgi:hypothetical protein